MRERKTGYTLIEIVISILLTAVMVSAVFSVALTTRQGGGKADRKLLAAQTTRSLTSVLKSYVTADTTNCVIDGPNAARPCDKKWNIYSNEQRDYNCTISRNAMREVTAVTLLSEQDVYALAPGNHCLECVADSSACLLPKVLRGPPYNAKLFYQVSPGSPPPVDVGVFWTEP